MNNLVQQLINPVIHKPTGGRIIDLMDKKFDPRVKKYVMEKMPRADYTRNPKIIARNKAWYDLSMEGFQIKQIAIAVGANPKTVSNGVLSHKKTLEAANG